ETKESTSELKQSFRGSGPSELVNLQRQWCSEAVLSQGLRHFRRFTASASGDFIG
ncbi:hypothetical protein A2U01_0103708, partial [Trifolium medium]|nr:hypothetical protein [Trifolium medium]